MNVPRTIRDAKVGDARVIAEITVRSWQTAYRNILPPARLDKMIVDRREEGWRAELVAGKGITLIAEERDKAVGWIALGNARDADCGDDVVELFGIYLDPNFWHRGIGRQLLDAGLSRLSVLPIREVVLWVFEENHRARRFYESAGFAHETGSARPIEIWGSSYPEIRYRRSVPVEPVDPA